MECYLTFKNGQHVKIHRFNSKIEKKSIENQKPIYTAFMLLDNKHFTNYKNSLEKLRCPHVWNGVYRLLREVSNINNFKVNVVSNMLWYVNYFT
jgi:hypothetical protein